ncbi:FAD-binding oxidoreductase, partial [bacterium M00.F.Ca.ET.221.01.1.1]
RAMFGTVDEVIAVTEAEGIDADIRRVDNITVATNAAQLQRARAEYEELLSWEMPPERLAFLDAREARQRIAIDKVLSAFVVRNVARVQPAKLVQGLAAAVVRLGVPIY